MNRRRFLHTSAAISALATAPRWLASAATAPTQAKLTVDFSGKRAPIPADFTGLSFETGTLSTPSFLSSRNKELVGLVRRISANGALRIGGNSSDFTFWKQHPEDVPPTLPTPEPGSPAARHPQKIRVIAPEGVDELKTFLDTTGWRLIYGIGLGHNDPSRAAVEAEYVSKKMGNTLIAFQVGNEPDLFHHNGIRPPQYKFADYMAEWTQFAQAVRKAAPGVPLAGPDVAHSVDWIQQFADSDAGYSFLSGHYYSEGPPDDPRMTIEKLLTDQQKLANDMQQILRIAADKKTHYRTTECNSCYQGGKQDVSDVLAAALWGADYMLQMAAWGATGVNFHTGSSALYTAIAGGSGSKPLEARPLYYALLLFHEFEGASFLPVTLDAPGVNLTAYAATSPRNEALVALINKEPEKDVRVNLGVLLHGTLDLRALTGKAVDSSEGVTYAGATVSGDGSWTPISTTLQAPKKDSLTITVPRASALVLRTRPQARPSAA